MRTAKHHFHPTALVLSVLVGWMVAGPGPAAAAGGPSVAAQAPKTAQTPRQAKPAQAPPLQAPALTPAPGNPVAVISTSLGDMRIELFKDKAPVSVGNFLQYVKEGFYTGTVFHRVIPGFMIQGGGFTPALVKKDNHPPILNEATNGVRNTRGTLAMARTAQLRSATSQFYINVADNAALDHVDETPQRFGYAVFGRVLSGMEVADKIVAVPTHSTQAMDNVPVTPVIIKSITLVK